MTRVCSDCPGPINARNQTGRCRSCAARHKNADPVARAKQAAGLAAFYNRPGVREAYAARARAANTNLSPEALERRREHGRRILARYNQSPDLRAKLNDPAMKAENGRKRSNTVLAWCPPEWRDHYRYLKKTMHYRAAEARVLVEAAIHKEQAKARREAQAREPGRDSLDRQLERVRNGARVIAKPVYQRPDYEFSLTGGSLA